MIRDSLWKRPDLESLRRTDRRHRRPKHPADRCRIDTVRHALATATASSAGSATSRRCCARRNARRRCGRGVRASASTGSACTAGTASTSRATCASSTRRRRCPVRHEIPRYSPQPRRLIELATPHPLARLILNGQDELLISGHGLPDVIGEDRPIRRIRYLPVA